MQRARGDFCRVFPIAISDIGISLKRVINLTVPLDKYYFKIPNEWKSSRRSILMIKFAYYQRNVFILFHNNTRICGVLDSAPSKNTGNEIRCKWITQIQRPLDAPRGRWFDWSQNNWLRTFSWMPRENL